MVEPGSLAPIAGRILLATTPRVAGRLRALVRGRHRVLVAGTTGTGKTQLIDSLTELIPPTISYLDRTSFSKSADVQVQKEFFRIWDTPGQKLMGTDRAQAIKDVSAKRFGVLNVVSYGYHEFRADLRTVFTRNNVSLSFLKRQREIELAQLGELVAMLRGREKLGWFITVVAKADLWWDDRAKVFNHYESGAYAEVLSPVLAGGGPVVLEYCSVIKPFYGRVGISASFSDEERRRAREQLLSSLLTAAARRQ